MNTYNKVKLQQCDKHHGAHIAILCRSKTLWLFNIRSHTYKFRIQAALILAIVVPLKGSTSVPRS